MRELNDYCAANCHADKVLFVSIKSPNPTLFTLLSLSWPFQILYIAVIRRIMTYMVGGCNLVQRTATLSSIDFFRLGAGQGSVFIFRQQQLLEDRVLLKSIVYHGSIAKVLVTFWVSKRSAVSENALSEMWPIREIHLKM